MDKIAARCIGTQFLSYTESDSMLPNLFMTRTDCCMCNFQIKSAAALTGSLKIGSQTDDSEPEAQLESARPQ